ncbi:MAG: SDR family oxidoreductase [Mycoplasmatales bacterium]
MNLYKKDFSNKTVVITGGSGILCFGMVKMFLENNANVAILDRNPDSIKPVEDQISRYKDNYIVIECDVLKKDTLLNARKLVRQKFGACDILINGAGGNHPAGTTDNEMMQLGDLDKDIKTFFDLEVEGFEFVMNLNFIGTLLPSQVFSEDMLNKKDCSIINISSMNAYTPLTKIPAYSGAKAAVSNFTQWLAVHFAQTGIRVNAIAPGFFVTTQNQKLLFDENNNPTPRTNKILNSTPMNRFGEPDELLGSILFLTDSTLSGFITGVIIPIDGGFNAYSGV